MSAKFPRGGGRTFFSSKSIKIKNLVFTPNCVSLGDGRHQVIITIDPSTMTPLSATVSRVMVLGKKWVVVTNTFDF